MNSDQEELDRLILKLYKHPEKDKLKPSVIQDTLSKLEKSRSTLDLSSFLENKDYQSYPILFINILHYILPFSTQTNYSKHTNTLSNILLNTPNYTEKDKIISIIFNINLHELLIDNQKYLHKLINFFIFECLLEGYENDLLFIIILSMLQNAKFNIDKYKYEFLIEIILLIGLNSSILKDEVKKDSENSDKKKRTLTAFVNSIKNTSSSSSSSSTNVKNYKIITGSCIKILFFYLFKKKNVNNYRKKNDLVKLILYLLFLNYFDNEEDLLRLLSKKTGTNNNINVNDNNNQFLQLIITDIFSNNNTEYVRDDFLNIENYNLTNLDLFFLEDKIDNLFIEQKEKVINNINNYKEKFKVWKQNQLEKIKNKISIKEILINMISCITKMWGRNLQCIIPITNILETFIKYIEDEYFAEKIIKSLLKLIIMNGENLFNEWDYVLKILKKLIDNEYNTGNRKILIENIITKIQFLLIKNKFKGDVNECYDIILSTKIHTNFINIIFKIQMALKDNIFFEKYINVIFDEYFIDFEDNIKKNKINIDEKNKVLVINYVFLYIKKYYLYYSKLINCNTDVENEVTLQKDKVNNYHKIIDLIENLLMQKLYIIIEEDTKLNHSNSFMISDAIINILFYTENINYYKDIIQKLFNYFDIKFDSSTSSQKGQNINEQSNLNESRFQIIITIIEELFIKLNNSYKYEKLLYLKDKLFNKKSMDIPFIIKIVIDLFAKFTISNDFTISLNENNDFTNKDINKLLILHYDSYKLRENKDNNMSKSDYKEYKNEYYKPYIYVNYIKVFDIITSHFTSKKFIYLKDNYISFYKLFFKNISMMNVSYNKFVEYVFNSENFVKLINLSESLKNNLIDITTNLLYGLTFDINVFKQASDKNDNKKINESNYILNREDIINQIVNCIIYYIENIARDINLYSSNQISSKLNEIAKWFPLLKIYLITLKKNFTESNAEDNNEKLENDDKEKDKEKNNEEKSDKNDNKVIDLNKICYIDFILRVFNIIFNLLKYLPLSQEYTISMMSLLYQSKNILCLIENEIDENKRYIEKAILILLILINSHNVKMQESIINLFKSRIITEENLNMNMIINYNFNTSNSSTIYSKSYSVVEKYIKFFAKIIIIYYMQGLNKPNEIKNINKILNESPGIFQYFCNYSLTLKGKRDNYLPNIFDLNLNNSQNDSKNKGHGSSNNTELLQIYTNKNSIYLVYPIDINNCCLILYNPIFNNCMLINSNNINICSFINQEYNSKINGKLYSNNNDQLISDREFDFIYKNNIKNSFLIVNSSKITRKRFKTVSYNYKKSKKLIKNILNSIQNINNKLILDKKINEKLYNEIKEDLKNPKNNQSTTYSQSDKQKINKANEYFFRLCSMNFPFNTPYRKIHIEKLNGKNINFLYSQILKLNKLSLCINFYSTIKYVPNNYNTFYSKNTFNDNIKLPDEYNIFLNKLGTMIYFNQKENSSLKEKILKEYGKDCKMIIKNCDNYFDLYFDVVDLNSNYTSSSELKINSLISIFWTDGHIIDYDLFVDNKINIFLCKIIEFYYVIRIIIKDDNAKRISLFSQLFPTSEFVIDFSRDDSYETLLQLILELNIFYDFINGKYEGKKEYIKQMKDLIERNKIIGEICKLVNY